MRRRRKRGQAAAAAALIAVIGALIILYIIFLQPADRADLLGDDTFKSRSGGGSRAHLVNETLLNETPGRIDFLSQMTIDHTIPTVHVFTQTEGSILEQKDSLYVERSLFSSTDAQMTFSLTDLVNTENLLLSFGVSEPRGRLTVTFNGEPLLTREIAVNSPPISLPRELLRAQNTMLFQVSSPGAAFWRTNRYTLEDVKITGDVTETDAQRSRSVFLISNVEFNNLDRAELKFNPSCNPTTAAPLEIWVNEFNVYSAVPDCGIFRQRIEFSPSYLKRGDNELIFSTERGDYVISQVTVESKLKQIDFPVYFFDLSEDQFQHIRNGSKDMVVRLDFVDTIDRKQGQIIVNGHVNGFDTKELYAEEEVSRDVERGSNSIKIKPEKTLDVRKITATLVDLDE